MPTINWPANPQLNDVYTLDNKSWTFNGVGWKLNTTAGPQGPIGLTGPAGPSAVSTDAGQLAELGTDSLILVAITPADIGAASTSADLADFTSGAATSGQVPTADGTGGVDWAEPSGGSGERRFESAPPYDYCGTAPAGTLDSATTWALTRITYNAAGSIVATETATDAWTNRATASYA